MIVLRELCGPGDFMPPGYGSLGNPDLVWLKIISDSLIVLSGFAILLVLLGLVGKRRDLPFRSVFVLFGGFIVACGATHAMEVWNRWHSDDWLAGGLDAVLALASIATALVLTRLFANDLGLPGMAGRGTAPKALEKEIQEHWELKRFELKLHESEQRFRVLVEGVKDYALVGLDLAGVVSSWNAGAERIKGYTAEEIVGANFSCFYPPADRDLDMPAKMLRRAAQDGMIEQEGWRVRKDGSQFWADVIITALRDNSGKLIGFAKITRDVTERRRLEQELREANELLEERVRARTLELAGANMELRNSQNEISALNASLEERVEERTSELVRTNNELESFSYSVSHDLRAPVRHIDGFARILKEELGAKLPREAHLYLDRILHAAGHMGHLVDDLLNLAQIGRKELVRQTVKMNDLVKQAIAETPSEQERVIEWRIEDLPELNCDAGLMKLVFINLLSNAAKFTRKCSTAIIEVGSFQADDNTTIFVRDNGVGFDPQYADKLFGVFQRLHRPEDFEGTGIGLATVQTIIHRHGGKIWGESLPNGGAAFFFTLGSPSAPVDARRLLEIQHA